VGIHVSYANINALRALFFIPYPSFFPLWLTVVLFPRLRVIRKPYGFVLCLYQKCFSCGGYASEELSFFVLLMNENTLDCLLVFVVTNPDFRIPNCSCSYQASLGYRRLIYQVDWLWNFSSSPYLIFLWLNWLNSYNWERTIICSQGLSYFSYASTHCVLTAWS